MKFGRFLIHLNINQNNSKPKGKPILALGQSWPHGHGGIDQSLPIAC
jgi:hypothetical protein